MQRSENKFLRQLLFKCKVSKIRRSLTNLIIKGHAQNFNYFQILKGLSFLDPPCPPRFFCFEVPASMEAMTFFTSLSDLIELTHPLEKRVSISVDESHSSRFCKHFNLIGPRYNLLL